MILVDTSVLINFFKGIHTDSSEIFKTLLQRDLPFALTSHIFQEVIQGAKNQKEFTLLKNYLITQEFYHPQHPDSFINAALLYMKAREKGYTIKSTIDCLVAQIAIENNLLLLHSDRDFDMLSKISDLKIYQS